MKETSGKESMMSPPGIAAVLSLVVPGIGQIYNGDFLRGIFWLIITPGFWIGTGGMLGWVCHLIAAYTAYSRGMKYMRGEIVK
jgi:TM2 domain-containing membrane protein YozV